MTVARLEKVPVCCDNAGLALTSGMWRQGARRWVGQSITSKDRYSDNLSETVWSSPNNKRFNAILSLKPSLCVTLPCTKTKVKYWGFPSGYVPGEILGTRIPNCPRFDPLWHTVINCLRPRRVQFSCVVNISVLMLVQYLSQYFLTFLSPG